MHQIRLLVAQMFDDNRTNFTSTKPIATEQEIVDRVAYANRVFAQAKIEFLFNPARDLIRINATLLNRSFMPLVQPDFGADGWRISNWPKPGPPDDKDRRDRARKEFANLFHGRIVIFLRSLKKWREDNDGIWRIGNAKNSSGGKSMYVNLHTDGASTRTLAHELGHYLQNWHPFAEIKAGENRTALENIIAKVKEYVDVHGHPKEKGLDVFDRDEIWVRDTPPDAGPSVFAELNLNECADRADFDVTFNDGSTRTYHLNPDRTNVMNYFGCVDPNGLRTMTGEQILRFRDGVETSFRHALITHGAPRVGKLVLLKEKTDRAVRDVEIAMLSNARMIFAGIDDKGKLTVNGWKYLHGGAGNIVKEPTAAGGEVKKVSLCVLGLGLFATPVIAASNRAKVILWEARPNGIIERRQDARIETSDDVEDIACCRFGYEYLAVAVRLKNRDVQIHIWEITAAGELTKHFGPSNTVNGFASLGSVSSMGMHSLDINGFVLFGRDSQSQELALSTHFFDDKDEEDNNKDDRRLLGADASFDDRHVKDIEACGLDLLTGAVVFINEHERLKIQAIEYKPFVLREGHHLKRRGTAQTSGRVRRFAVCRVGTQMLATPIMNVDERLKVIVWAVTPQGYHVRRLDDQLSVRVNRIACCHAGERMFAVAARTLDEGNLLIQMWKVTDVVAGSIPDIGASDG